MNINCRIFILLDYILLVQLFVHREACYFYQYYVLTDFLNLLILNFYLRNNSQIPN